MDVYGLEPWEAVTEEDSTGIIRLIRGSALIARNTDAARTYYHYASDEMGSTTHIVDENGKVQNRYEYDAWGNITAQEEAIPNRFKYTGQQLDPVTQQYYLRARFYNPVIARFTQEDTYRGDGLNLYAYCANNPVFYVDPSGNEKDVYTKINPKEIRFSQSSVNGAKEIISIMKEHGWKGTPIDVVIMPDNKITTIDNTRVVAARYAGIDTHSIIHKFDDILPSEMVERFTTPKGKIPVTWGDAITLRIGNQNKEFRTIYPYGSQYTGWSGN